MAWKTHYRLLRIQKRIYSQKRKCDSKNAPAAGLLAWSLIPIAGASTRLGHLSCPQSGDQADHLCMSGQNDEIEADCEKRRRRNDLPELLD